MTMQPKERLAKHIAGLYIKNIIVPIRTIDSDKIEVLMLEEKPLEWWGTPQDFRNWVGRVAVEIFEYNAVPYAGV